MTVRTALELAAGQAMPAVHMQNLWRLEAGALRVGALLPDGSVDLISMSLPGDLVCVEQWADAQTAGHISAVLPTRLVLLEAEKFSAESLLREALLTARQRSKEMVIIRSGPVAERVRALLLILARTGSVAGCSALPRVKETAELVGSTAETVCRVITHLKQLQLLAHQCKGSWALDIEHLRDARFTQGMTSSVPHVRAATGLVA